MRKLRDRSADSGTLRAGRVEAESWRRAKRSAEGEDEAAALRDGVEQRRGPGRGRKPRERSPGRAARRAGSRPCEKKRTATPRVFRARISAARRRGARAPPPGEAPDIQSSEQIIIDFPIRPDGHTGAGADIAHDLDLQHIARPEPVKRGRRLRQRRVERAAPGATSTRLAAGAIDRRTFAREQEFGVLAQPEKMQRGSRRAPAASTK